MPESTNSIKGQKNYIFVRKQKSSKSSVRSKDVRQQKACMTIVQKKDVKVRKNGLTFIFNPKVPGLQEFYM